MMCDVWRVLRAQGDALLDSLMKCVRCRAARTHARLYLQDVLTLCVVSASFPSFALPRRYAVQYKDRVDMKQILPAVAWKDAGSATAKVLKGKK
jgi:hypothetical protein